MKITSKNLRSVIKKIIKEQTDRISIKKLKSALDTMEKSGQKDFSITDVNKLVKQAMDVPAPFGAGDVRYVPRSVSKTPAVVPAPPASVMATKPAFTEAKGSQKLERWFDYLFEPHRDKLEDFLDKEDYVGAARFLKKVEPDELGGWDIDEIIDFLVAWEVAPKEPEWLEEVINSRLKKYLKDKK